MLSHMGDERSFKDDNVPQKFSSGGFLMGCPRVALAIRGADIDEVKNRLLNPFVYKGIIFDCDGTLIDSEGLHLQAWKMAIQKRGFHLHDELYLSFAGLPADQVSAKLHALIKEDTPQKITDDKRKIYHDLQKTEVRPIKRTLDLLCEIKKYPFKLGCASGAAKEELLLNLKAIGIENHFHVIVSGVEDLLHIQDPEGVNKPKPYIYLQATSLLGLKPQECLALEDSFVGVHAAKKAGLKTIAIPNTYTLDQDFSLADIIIKPHDPLNLSLIL